MNDKPKNPFLFLSLMCMTMLVSLSLGLLVTPADVSADLPPRPTPVPTKTPTATADRAKSDSSSRAYERLGAYIRLSSPANTGGLWTVVQWQGNDGRWHDVEGWRGTFEGGEKVWWVAPSDFGTGPFRWVVYQYQDGPRVGISPPFKLPTSSYQSLQISVILAQ